MSIYRRNEVWWYQIAINGKQYRGSCKTRNEVQAQEFHDRIRADIWRGKFVGDRQRRTVEEAIKRFLDERSHKKSARDDIRIAAWWEDQLAREGAKYLDEVTPDLIKEIRDAENGRMTPRGPIKPATVNRKLALLSAVVLTAAKEWLWLEHVPKFRMLAGEVQRRRYLRPDELSRLIDALPQPYSDMALFAVSTGLRQANVFGLRWDGVNLNHRTATFAEKVMKNGLPFTMPLNATAIEVIRRQLGKHDEYVFCKTSGERLTEMSSKVWKKAIGEAGLEDVRWHDLRHTCASLMRQGGVGLDTLQELGGWQSRDMVQRYAHLNVEHLAPSASVIDGLFRAKENRKVQILHSAA